MKDKTEAAKVLLEAGWTWDEIELVLSDKPTFIPQPYPVPTPAPQPNSPWLIPLGPTTAPGRPWWNDTITICDTAGNIPWHGGN